MADSVIGCVTHCIIPIGKHIMGSLGLKKAKLISRKRFSLAVIALLLIVLTIFSTMPTEAAELTATVKKYGNNWAVIYNPGEIYFAFEEVAKAELVAINTTNGTSYVVKVRDNAGRDLPVTYTEAREYMQSKGYWQGEDLSKIQIQKQTNQWWIIYPTTGQKVAFESVAKISLTFEITDNYDNVLPTTYGEALPYMQSKGLWVDRDDTHEEEEKGFWAFVKTKLEEIWTSITDTLDAIKSIGVFLVNGNIVGALIAGLTQTAGPFAGQLCTTIFEFTDQAELLFNSYVGQIFTGLAKNVGFIIWIIGFFMATVEIGINLRGNRAIGDSLHDYVTNAFKSFLGVIFFTTIPLPLYLFISKLAIGICSKIGLWGANELTTPDFTNFNQSVLNKMFPGSSDTFFLVFLIVLIFCGIKVLFAGVKRGGILMILILVGSVHMINIPRGYWDAFWSWCRQIVALCITQFCQMLLFCGGMAIVSSSLQTSNLLVFFAGLGMFLAAAEVPRIADRFGLDSSLKGNAMGAVQTVAMVARMVITKGA